MGAAFILFGNSQTLPVEYDLQKPYNCINEFTGGHINDYCGI